MSHTYPDTCANTACFSKCWLELPRPTTRQNPKFWLPFLPHRLAPPPLPGREDFEVTQAESFNTCFTTRHFRAHLQSGRNQDKQKDLFSHLGLPTVHFIQSGVPKRLEGKPCTCPLDSCKENDPFFGQGWQEWPN